MVSNIMGYVKDEYKTWIFNVFIKWIFGIAVFGLLISENLTNIMDGIWNGTYMFGGDWETSIGRWFIRYVDKFRFGIAVNPFISIVSLLVYGIGTEMLAGVFEIKRKALNYFISFLFISSTIVCVSLSYTYTAVVFAICFMLAILAVLFLKLAVGGQNTNAILVVLSAISVALSLGLYQQYFGAILLAILLIAIKLMLAGDIKDVIRWIVNSAISCIFGAAMYFVVLKVELHRYGLTMSSYNGGDTLSVQNIFADLKTSIPRTYTEFYNYFVGNSFHHNMFESKWVMKAVAGLLVIFMVIAAASIIKKALNLVLYVVAIAVIPIACSPVMVLIPSSQFLIQQTGVFALVIPMLLALYVPYLSEQQIFMREKLIEKGRAAGKGKEANPVRIVDFAAKVICACVFAVFLWGNIYQVQTDQLAMHEGKVATETLSQNILTNLIADGYYSGAPEAVGNGSNFRIAIIGYASGNSLFAVTDNFTKANGYARFGLWAWRNNLDSRSWNGVFRYYLGVNLPFVMGDEYEALLTQPEIQEMPCYPNEGAIRVINGVTVVKVSQ